MKSLLCALLALLALPVWADTQVRTCEATDDFNDYVTGPTPGGAHDDRWQMVDEDSTNANLSGHDGDTTYLDNTSGFNTFGLCSNNNTIPAGSTVTSVTVNGMVKDPAASTFPQCGASIRVNSSNYTGSQTSTTGSYAAKSETWNTNPDTTAAWTVDEVNGVGVTGITSFGVRCANLARVTAINLVVTFTPPAGGASVPAILRHLRQMKQ